MSKPKTRNPLKLIAEYREKKKLERIKRLSKRDEQMKQDFECYLMNLEERLSWEAYELNNRNYQRMLREQKAALVEQSVLLKDTDEKDTRELETGLSFFRGSVQENQKWQNSPAKILDLKGHMGPITSCKLSSDYKYLLSCSADKTAMLWNMKNGKIFRVYTGHSRRVTDGDFHPHLFNSDQTEPCIVTCSVDCTLKLWNATGERPLRTLTGHGEAVYKCSFCPDGQRIVSCSEDLTIRTWCFPEGYQLFVYRYHNSPITTVKFSPTGRYLVSGSDYGERKLYIWDASLPSIENSIQYPHMVFWNRDGMIKKLLLRSLTPAPEFWLTADQAKSLPSSHVTEMWPGELTEDVMDSESEDEFDDDRSEKDVDEDFSLTDVREMDGVFLTATVVDLKSKEHSVANNYIPGHYLIITIQSMELPVIDAFISVNVRQSQYDVFTANSGERIGKFNADEAIPLKPYELARLEEAKALALDRARVAKELKELHAMTSFNVNTDRLHIAAVDDRYGSAAVGLSVMNSAMGSVMNNTFNSTMGSVMNSVMGSASPVFGSAGAMSGIEEEDEHESVDSTGDAEPVQSVENDKIAKRTVPKGLSECCFGEAVIYRNSENAAKGDAMIARALAIRRGERVVDEEPEPIAQQDDEDEDDQTDAGDDEPEAEPEPEVASSPMSIRDSFLGLRHRLSSRFSSSDLNVNEESRSRARTLTQDGISSSALGTPLGNNSPMRDKDGSNRTLGSEDSVKSPSIKAKAEKPEKPVEIVKPFELETIWCCPLPDKGSAVICANLTIIPKLKPISAEEIEEQKKRKTPKGPTILVPKRIRLTYSLKESAVRLNATRFAPIDKEIHKNAQFLSKKKKDEPLFGKAVAAPVYLFDQEVRHKVLMQFIIDKQWDSVEAMFDNKSVMYLEEVVYRRPWRITDALAQLFEDAPSMVVPTAFVHRDGLTRSVAICEASEIGVAKPPDADIVKEIEPADEEEDENEDDEEDDDEEKEKVKAVKHGDVHGVHEGDDSSTVVTRKSGVPIVPWDPTTSPTPHHVPPNQQQHQSATNHTEDAPGLSVHTHTEAKPAHYGRRKAQLLTLRKNIPVDADVLSAHEQVMLQLQHQHQLAVAAAEKKKLRNINALGQSSINQANKSSQYTYIRNNRFGPQEILQFTMPLPKYFPQNAGNSSRAFKHQLTKYYAIQEAIRKAALPSAFDGITVEDVQVDMQEESDEGSSSEDDEEVEHHDGEGAVRDDISDVSDADTGDRHNSHGHARNSNNANDPAQPSTAVVVRKRKKKLEVLVKYYSGGRRTAAAHAPGMAPHYPNPNYINPAPVPPFPKDPNRNRSKLIAALVGLLTFNKGPIGNLIPAVGRKLPPTEEELAIIATNAANDQVVELHPSHPHHRNRNRHLSSMYGTPSQNRHSSTNRRPSTSSQHSHSTSSQRSTTPTHQHGATHSSTHHHSSHNSTHNSTHNSGHNSAHVSGHQSSAARRLSTSSQQSNSSHGSGHHQSGHAGSAPPSASMHSLHYRPRSSQHRSVTPSTLDAHRLDHISEKVGSEELEESEKRKPKPSLLSRVSFKLTGIVHAGNNEIDDSSMNISADALATMNAVDGGRSVSFAYRRGKISTNPSARMPLSVKDKQKMDAENYQKALENYLASRRGSFPIAPGLEAFTDTKPLLFAEQSQSGQAASSAVTKHVKAPLKGTLNYFNEKERTLLHQKVGLIRSCSIHGFEVVHHGSINDATFSPSEKRLVSAGGDGLIKIWDPRDGTYIRQFETYNYLQTLVDDKSSNKSLPRKSTGGEVLCVAYTNDELYLVSAGTDAIILIWDLTTCCVTRCLKGHADIISCISITGDCNQLVSGAYDGVMKTWFLTPRHPDAPDPPRVIARTDSTMLVTWDAPPSYNEELTAFHFQYRVGTAKEWKPDEGISMPPYFRSRIVPNLAAATPYQYRLRAENRMGISEWGEHSKQEFTSMGLPAQISRPIAVEVTRRTVSLCWFAANPTSYGAASRRFMVRRSGEGKAFEDYPADEVLLEQGGRLGEAILEGMKADIAAADLQAQHFHVGKHRNEHQDHGKTAAAMASEEILDVPDVTVPVFMSIADKRVIVEKSKDDSEIFVKAVLTNFKPGFMYRFIVQAVNVVGAGLPSLESYSVSTQPDRPEPPEVPVQESSTLHSITWKWASGDDGGTALTGYRVYVKHMERHVDLGRGSVSYTLRGLLAGKQYYIRVASINAVGMSEYSEYNTDAESYTATGKPDVPEPMHAVAGNWASLTMEAWLPHCNGAPITQIMLQYREIEPFSKGNWTRPKEYEFSELKVLIPAEEEKDEESDEEPVIEEEHLELDADGKPKKKRQMFAMMKKKVVHRNKMAMLMPVEQPRGAPKTSGVMDDENGGGILDGAKLSKQPEVEAEVVHKIKGAKIQLTIGDLRASIAYEFRYAARNHAGLSDFSLPSQRALTTKAIIPGEPRVPVVSEILTQISAIVLMVESHVTVASGKKTVAYASTSSANAGTAPKKPKHPVEYIHFEAKECTLNIVRPLPKFHVSHDHKYLIPALTPGVIYQFRCKFENDIGIGTISQWTSEIRMPAR